MKTVMTYTEILDSNNSTQFIPLEVLRVKDEEADAIVENGEGMFMPKSAYKNPDNIFGITVLGDGKTFSVEGFSADGFIIDETNLTHGEAILLCRETGLNPLWAINQERQWDTT